MTPLTEPGNDLVYFVDNVNDQQPSPSKRIQETMPWLNVWINNLVLLALEMKGSSNLSITEICSLKESIIELRDIIQQMTASTAVVEQTIVLSIIKSLKVLGNIDQSPDRAGVLQYLFSHFEPQIKNIIRDLLHTTGYQDLMLKVAEKCHKEACSPAGTLSDHEPLLRCKRRTPNLLPQCSTWEEYKVIMETRREFERLTLENQKRWWINFWATAVNNAPNRPIPQPSFPLSSLNNMNPSSWSDTESEAYPNFNP